MIAALAVLPAAAGAQDLGGESFALSGNWACSASCSVLDNASSGTWSIQGSTTLCEEIEPGSLPPPSCGTATFTGAVAQTCSTACAETGAVIFTLRDASDGSTLGPLVAFAAGTATRNTLAAGGAGASVGSLALAFAGSSGTWAVAGDITGGWCRASVGVVCTAGSLFQATITGAA